MARKNKNQSLKWANTQKIIKYANNSITDTLDQLKVPSFGLTEEYVHSKKKIVNLKAHFPFWKYLLHSFKDVFTWILIAIIAYNFVMYALNPDDITYVAGGSLVTVLIIISILFDTFTNYSIWKSNVKLRANQQEYANVLRNVILNTTSNPFSNPETEKNMIDRLTEIKVSNLLKGDVIFLKQGDVIPADAKIIYSSEFSVDQEILIGSNIPMHKKYFNSSLSSDIFYLSNIVYRGTKVTNGTAWALVLYKGDDTFYETKILAEVPDKENSSFNDQIKRVTNILIYTLIAIVPTIFIMVGLLKSSESGFKDTQAWIDSLVFAMAIAIALSPDSLPLMLNASFARTRIRLGKKNINVKNLTSIQNIGAMDVLAIDAEKVFLNHEFIIKDYKNILNYNDNKILDYLILTFINDPTNDPTINSAILDNLKLKKRIDAVAKRYEFINKFSFNNLTYIHLLDKELNKEMLIKRDSDDKSIANATFYDNGKGIVRLTTPRKKKHLLSLKHDSFLSYGITYKYLDEDIAKIDNKELFIKDYVYLGVTNFINTVKAGSSSIIKEIQKEDISVVMFSRKTLTESIALAKELDFTIDQVMSGAEVDKMNDSQLMRKLSKISLFYNLDLLTEVRIIKIYKKNKNTIGFLGKDIEDSFQLLNADIGITLDNSDFFGKKCSSLILSHLDLMQLITAIRESRSGLMNMMKYIKLKVTWSISLTVKLVIGILLLNEEPMTAIQLLVQNMIFDLIEYTIIYDNIDEHYILKPVKWKTTSIIPFALVNGTVLVGMFAIMLLIVIFALEPGSFHNIRNQTGNYEEQLKVIQTTSIIEDSISHLIFIFVARDNFKVWWRERPTKLLFWSLIAGMIFFIAVPFIPATHELFNASNPPWPWYLMLIGEMTIIMFLIDQVKNIYLKKKISWF